MSRPPNLKTAMTPFPYSVAPDASLEEARALMEEHEVRHLPVVIEHRVVGILTPTDLTTAQLEKPDAERLTVEDCYEREVYVVELDEPLEHVLLTMAERHIGSAIVTRHGRLAGVFTTVDACRSFGDYLSENYPHGDGDDAA